MIFEWAELGTLRDVHQNYKIDWEAKISIVRDICCGLVFAVMYDNLFSLVNCDIKFNH